MTPKRALGYPPFSVLEALLATDQRHPKTQVGYSQGTSTVEKTCCYGGILCAGSNHCEFWDIRQSVVLAIYLGFWSEKEAKFVLKKTLKSWRICNTIIYGVFLYDD